MVCWLVSASPQVNAPRQARPNVGSRWYRTVWYMSTAQNKLFIAKTSPVMLYSHCFFGFFLDEIIPPNGL